MDNDIARLEKKINGNSTKIGVVAEDVKEIKENHLPHITDEQEKQGKAISFIKGQLYVAIPLLIAILGAIAAILIHVL